MLLHNPLYPYAFLLFLNVQPIPKKRLVHPIIYVKPSASNYNFTLLLQAPHRVQFPVLTSPSLKLTGERSAAVEAQKVCALIHHSLSFGRQAARQNSCRARTAPEPTLSLCSGSLHQTSSCHSPRDFCLCPRPFACTGQSVSSGPTLPRSPVTILS